MIAWGGGALFSISPFIITPIVGVVLIGPGAGLALNILDKKFRVTDKLVELIEAARKEFIEKAREIEKGVWELGAMFVDGMLRTGREFFIEETKKHLRDSLKDIIPGRY